MRWQGVGQRLTQGPNRDIRLLWHEDDARPFRQTDAAGAPGQSPAKARINVDLPVPLAPLNSTSRPARS